MCRGAIKNKRCRRRLGHTGPNTDYGAAQNEKQRAASRGEDHHSHSHRQQPITRPG